MKQKLWLIAFLMFFLSQTSFSQGPCGVDIYPSWNVSVLSLTAVDSAQTQNPSYVWSTGETTGGINAFTAGNYCVTATFSNGCTAVNCFQVTYNCTANLQYDQWSKTLQGFGTPSYIPTTNYLWSNGATTSTLQNVAPGYYCLTVTKANGCTAVACDTVAPNCLLYIQNNGQTLTAISDSSSTSPQYIWSTGETTATITPQSTGNYCVTMTTPSGCYEKRCSYFLLPIPSCPVNLSNTAGVISVLPNGAVPSAYQWSTGATTSTVTVNTNTQVCVTVTYGNNCSNTGCTFAYDPANCAVGINSYMIDDSVSGQVTLLQALVYGNTWDWSYDWGNNNKESFIYATTPGEYCVTVTNTISGCSATNCFWVQPGGACTASIQAEPLDYENFTLSVTGGPDPIQNIVWKHGGSGNQTTVNEAGVYQVNVTTSTGCTVSAAVRLFEHKKAYISALLAKDSVYDKPLTTSFYLIKYDPAQGGTLTAVDIVENYGYSNTGAMIGQFTNFQPGEYLLKAALKPNSQYYGKYLPTYHEDAALWSDATTVVLRKLSTSQFEPFFYIDMIPTQNFNGPGFVGGKVSEGANLTGSGGHIESEGDPMPNMNVVLTKADGTPLKHALTNAEGQYSFSNLPWGTYVIWLDIPGIKPVSITVVLGPNNPKSTGRDFKVDDNSAISSTDDLEIVQGARIYPNPTSDVIWVDLRAQAQISLSNTKGQIVQQINDASGTTRLSTENLPAGIYLLSVRRADAVQTFKIVKK
jgi:hypothetical protein